MHAARVARLTSSGNTDGNGTNARFNSPEGLATDANDDLYVADTGNHRVRRITPNGDVTTVAGLASGYLDANGTSAKFNSRSRPPPRREKCEWASRQDGERLAR